MLKVKVPEKYYASRLNGVLIRELRVDEEFGRVIVIAEDTQKKEFYVDPEKVAQHSADYILCDIQDDQDIMVQKTNRAIKHKRS